jgi:hypothetical protein
MPDRAKPESTPREIVHAAGELMGLRWWAEMGNGNHVVFGALDRLVKFEVTYRRVWK